MNHDTATALRRGRSPRRRRRPLLWLSLVLVAALTLAVSGAFWRLTNGPLRIDGMSERVASAIAGSIGPGWRVDLRDSTIELDSENSLALQVAGLDIHNPDGALVLRAPMAVVSLDTWGLLRLAVQPRAIEFRDLQMTALVHRDGSIAFAGSDPAHAAAEPHTLPSVDSARGNSSPISAAIASIFGIVLDPAGVVGALDRARITNGRLTLIDDDARQRGVFEHVNGLFRRDAVRDSRVFELRIDGPHGEWRFGGDLHEGGDGKRNGIITLDDLPVTDLLLLSGQSKLPIETDLKVSAKAEAGLNNGRIETLKATVKTSDGNFLIEEKDFNPVTIESLTASVSWDEAKRVLNLDSIDYLGAGNAVHLAGVWTASPVGGPTAWTLALAGKDAILRGAARTDKPVKLDALSAHVTGRDGGMSIDEFTVAGAGGATGRVTGTIDTSADEGGLTLKISAAHTDGRMALRLWPEHIAPPAREYLVDNLQGGLVDKVDITVDMSGNELAAATRGEPMPDSAIHIDFAVSNATLAVSEGAPPLSRGRVTGTITGLTTNIRGVTADIKMPDDRTLFITDGSFVIPKITPDTVTAQIGLKLGGGADALVALLQTKMFKNLTGVEIDPATVKGNADLRIDFPLNLKRIPELPDLPVSLTGTLSDLAVEKAFGKEKLENGRFAVTYERGGFALKGDGRVLGSPLTLDLRQPKAGAPGEVNATLLLDEALRARRGLPVAPQLAGPIPLKINLAIGKGSTARSPIRMEADLSRASIDGLIPGFVKPAGKPGRVSFVMTEVSPGGAMDLRDIVLDAGSASARGTAAINGDGQFDRADLSSFKLSPGDDMRIQIDRSGNLYKVGVKGAVADARPFMKSLGGPEGKALKESGRDQSKEIEADISLGIITGFNGEALTGATAKLSMKGKDFRSGRLQGRFNGAGFSAVVSRSGRGEPSINIETTDAGATLRFVDIYKRMYGGRLVLGSTLGDGPQTGVVQIRDFMLRNEPALSSIMAQGPATSEVVDAKGRKQIIQNAGNDVSFDRLRANFTRTGSRVDFTDAAISNAAMGFTMSGYLDTAKERTDINGTFVPLYGLNNVVSRLPLFGQLLGGGNNEGLFALNFRVSGRLSKPDVSVNPLSALAPGILRRLFSAGGNDGFPGATSAGETER
ncbi:DUF3971 domain-containing protein [Methylobacterium sp. Leaf93]|uniref:YhdP family protein n=1 Tax=Methylobacterium sp. Leaf93 TaxID=1736249 RepID=UPI0006FA6350|nr:DUF3971 domain-containing protein [Methylobacterium sp. Leaf93]KQP05409.1 hypothetical protein ASF26_08170 [Methylobacterium sp. Leaf93]